MNEKKLLRAIGQIEEDFIMEAKDNNQKVKKLHFRKIAVIAIAATMMLGVGTWAASSLIIARSSSSSRVPEFKTIPTTSEIKEIVGTELTLPEEFSNGYKFDAGRKLENSNYGENNDVVETFKSLTNYYKKGEDRVILSIDPLNIGNETLSGELVDTYNGCDIYYGGYTAKFVPGDYEMTEQDKQDEASGKYVFSYGSSEIETQEIQGLGWKDDGVHYNMTTMDSPLSKEDIISMAKEMIDVQ